MKIVVFGATASYENVVNEALKKGHEVTIVTRNARKVTTRHEHLHIVEGNVADKNIIEDRNPNKGI